MTLKDYFYPKAYSNSISTALVILRIVMGTAFVLHGFGKIQHPFGWMPPESGVPAVFQFLAAISEFFGGLFLILGLLTPLAALGIFCTMSVAVFFHGFVRHDPFVNQSGGAAFELPLLYWSMALLFMMVGPGAYSLDAQIFKKRKSHI